MTQQKVLFPSLDTPAIIVDLDKLESNINEMARMTSDAGIGLKPHAKEHKCPYIAKLEIEKGATGITASKLSEAEAMADNGIDDIMIVHPFYGEYKWEALKKLVSRPNVKIRVVVDAIEQAEGISQVGQAVGNKIPVLLKIDTGTRRFGVLPGAPTLKMAKELTQIPGIELVGILAHESAFKERTAEGVDRIAFEHTAVVAKTANMLKKEGIHIEIVATGASATARGICRYHSYFPEITEIHPGGYALGDWMYVNAFTMPEDSCAATILTTVIGTAVPGLAVIDAGDKTVGVELLPQTQWKPDYLVEGKPKTGTIKGRPDLRLEDGHEEVGMLRLMDPKRGARLGERLEILPNRISFAIALHDKMYGVRNGVVEREIPIACRCKDY